MTTTGTHTTPIHEYVDDLTFTFESVKPPGVSCVVKVNYIPLFQKNMIYKISQINMLADLNN